MIVSSEIIVYRFVNVQTAIPETEPERCGLAETTPRNQQDVIGLVRNSIRDWNVRDRLKIERYGSQGLGR